jgi:hypothetical protein
LYFLQTQSQNFTDKGYIIPDEGLVSCETCGISVFFENIILSLMTVVWIYRSKLYEFNYNARSGKFEYIFVLVSGRRPEGGNDVSPGNR